MTYPYQRFDKIPYPVYGRTKTPTDGPVGGAAGLAGGRRGRGDGRLRLAGAVQPDLHPGPARRQRGHHAQHLWRGLQAGGQHLSRALRRRVPLRGRPRRPRVLGSPRSTAGPGWSGSRRPATRRCLSPTSPPWPTWPTPAACRCWWTTPRRRPPCSSRMALGADIVLLSITKFLCGNATVLGGAIVGPGGAGRGHPLEHHRVRRRRHAALRVAG